MNRQIVAACLFAALLGGGFVLARHADVGAATPDPGSAIQTALPGLTPATGEPVLDGLLTASPEADTVAELAGPFDDRFEFRGLSFDGTTVTGRVVVTSDVSDLLELQVLAGFYSKDGALLGSARFTHHLEEDGSHVGPPSEVEPFRIVVPKKFRGEAAGAAVGVPVLVNE